MAETMQLYWIPWDYRPDGAEPVPGAFVFGRDSQTHTAGFIVAVEMDPKRCLICLWKPMPAHPLAEVIRESMSDGEVQVKLGRVLEKHPKMKMRWLEAQLLMWKN
jgi:hypothetical protein